MFFIRTKSDNMWLMGCQNMGCPIPTCIWGENFHDANPFEHEYEARALADRIGGVVVRALPKILKGGGHS